MYLTINCQNDTTVCFRSLECIANFIARKSPEIATFDEHLSEEGIGIEFCGKEYSYSWVFQKVDRDHYEHAKEQYYIDVEREIKEDLEHLDINRAVYSHGFYIAELPDF